MHVSVHNQTSQKVLITVKKKKVNNLFFKVLFALQAS